MKKTFNYLWNNLYDRYSILILSNYNIIVLFWTIFLIYGCYTTESGGALAFAILFFDTLIIDIIVYLILLIILILESKNIIKKRIKDSPKINNKFYKTIFIVSIISMFFYFSLIFYFGFSIFLLN